MNSELSGSRGACALLGKALARPMELGTKGMRKRPVKIAL